MLNRIIFCLSGGIANQLLSSLGDVNYKSFEIFLIVFEDSTDIAQARKYARAIVLKKLRTSSQFSVITDHDDVSIQNEIDKIIEDCYDIAWSFINYHKDEVIKIADLLVMKGRVSGDEIYNLIDANKPLYDFEQGPLSKSLSSLYVLRGYAPEVDDEDEVQELY